MPMNLTTPTRLHALVASPTAAARCGFLEVPENPAEPDGKQIRLHVAVGDATSQTPAEDPLFFFAGGPG